jgi:hypothetical protein
LDPGNSQSDQCDLPIASRQGSWFCGTSTAQSAQRVIRDAQRSLGSKLVTNAEVAATAADVAYCTVAGCWDMIDTAHATFTGTGHYGYGSTKLGDVELYFKVTTSGSKITTYPFWFSSSRGTRDIYLNAEYLYMSAAYPGGNSQNPRQYSQKHWSSASGGVSTKWPSPGIIYYDSVQKVTVSAEATWSDYSSNYPGSWYTWAKSLELDKQSNGAYYVVYNRPENSSGAGYRS